MSNRFRIVPQYKSEMTDSGFTMSIVAWDFQVLTHFGGNDPMDEEFDTYLTKFTLTNEEAYELYFQYWSALKTFNEMPMRLKELNKNSSCGQGDKSE